MKFIGITGGVGAGKSFILSFLEENYNAIVVRADDLAKSLMAPGSTCHEQLEAAFGDDGVFDENREIRAEVLAKLIYENPGKREELNAIVHPAVKEVKIIVGRFKRPRDPSLLTTLPPQLLP